MKSVFAFTIGLAIILLSSAFVNYSDENDKQSQQVIPVKSIQSYYYVNPLGDRVEVSNPDLHGCCYLVMETRGGRTCQKINF